MNNDGAHKMSYTAPSIHAQVAVISEALAVSRIDASTVSYVEAHGTGTALGDPIEMTALTQALAQLWKSWGIKPDVVMGHSVGEYVAACIAGVFSLEDGLKLIAHLCVV